VIYPRYRLRTVTPISRQAVLDAFGAELDSAIDSNASVWETKDGEVLKFTSADDPDVFHVEFMCRFRVGADRDVAFGNLGLFVALCQRSDGRIKIVRNNSVVKASGGIMSDVFRSQAYRIASHLAENPKDRLSAWGEAVYGQFEDGEVEMSSVADEEGPWMDPDFESSLIQRCRLNWYVPIGKLSNYALATFIRQKTALGLVVPEARRRLAARYRDGTELHDKELAVAVAAALRAFPEKDARLPKPGLNEYDIVEIFEIARGVVVVLGKATERDVGKPHRVEVALASGQRLSANAFKEWLLRRNSDPMESEAFLLPGLQKSDVPVGAKLRFVD
jgi:hypothetical protein